MSTGASSTGEFTYASLVVLFRDIFTGIIYEIAIGRGIIENTTSRRIFTTKSWVIMVEVYFQRRWELQRWKTAVAADWNCRPALLHLLLPHQQGAG